MLSKHEFNVHSKVQFVSSNEKNMKPAKWPLIFFLQTYCLFEIRTLHVKKKHNSYKYQFYPSFERKTNLHDICTSTPQQLSLHF